MNTVTQHPEHLEKPAVSQHPRRTLRRYWRTALWCAFGIALVWAVPNALAWCLRRNLTALVGPYIRGSLHAGAIRLGWWLPLTIEDLEFYGEQEPVHPAVPQSLGSVERIVTELTLWRLLWRPTDLGKVHVFRPRLVLAPQHSSWNWVEFLKPLLDQPPSKRPWQFSWESHDLRLDILDPQGHRLARCQGKQFYGSCRRDALLSVQTFGEVTVVASGNTGELRWQITWGDFQGGSAKKANLDLQNVPAEVFCALLDPGSAYVRAHGSLSGQIEALVADAWEIKGRDLRWRDGGLGTWFMDASETIPIRDLVCDGHLTRTEGELSLRVDSRCEWGMLLLSMTAPQPWESHPSRWLDVVQADFESRWDVATVLPHLRRTLKLQDQIVVDSGGIYLRGSLDPEPQQRRCQIELSTTEWTAWHEQKRIVWPRPLSVRLAVLGRGNTWSLEQLDCRAEFGEVSLATVTPDHAAGQLRIDINLDRLSERLAEFFTWDTRLLGHLAGTMEWQSQHEGFQLRGELDGQRCAIRKEGHELWGAPSCRIGLEMAGKHTESGAWHCTALRFETIAGADRLLAELQPPLVPDKWREAWWRIEGQFAVPGLAHAWLRTLASGIEVDGDAVLKTELRVDKEGVELRNGLIGVRQLFLRSGTIQFSDPQLEAELQRARWHWNSKDNALELHNIKLKTSSLQTKSSLVHWRRPAMNARELFGFFEQLEGDFAVDADLMRLSESFKFSNEPIAQIRGELAAQITFERQIQCRGTIHQFFAESFASAQESPVGTLEQRYSNGKLTWLEPQVQWHFVVKPHSSGQWNLEEIHCRGTGWSLTAAGTLTGHDAIRWQLGGNLTYDWQQLTVAEPLRTTYGVVVEGSRVDSFLVEGAFGTADQAAPNATSYSRGELALGWSRMEAAGMVFGPGVTQWRWEPGNIAVVARRIPVNDGFLALDARVTWSDGQPILSIQPGKLLEGVSITPQMCRTWLKYVHPIVAEATQAEGRLGIELRQAVIPLTNVHDTQAEGALLLEKGSVGPGPLTQLVVGGLERIAAIADRRLPRLHALATRTWIEIPPQVVPFLVHDARVFHRHLEMLVGQVQLTSQGSVGWDESLDLDLQLRLPERWFVDRPLLGKLRGQTVQIPLRGTLRRPEIDEQFFLELARIVLGDGTGGLLPDGLLQGLERLFRNR